MTTDEFKKIKPEYANVEGDELWDAMTAYYIRQQAGQEVMKPAMPFFKKYQLRWLFYRKLPNMVFVKGDYTSDTRCKICKKGTGLRWFFNGKMMCAGLDHEYQEEPNTSIKHRLYKIWEFINWLFWTSMDELHIVRSSHEERYDMFGDESKYVSHYSINMDTGETKHYLKPRKWWEYIFIERKTFNF